MRRQGVLPLLVSLLLVVTACDQPGAVVSTGQQGAVLLAYERTGGIAGFQDRLVIGYAGEYYLLRASQEYIGTLGRDERKQLGVWMKDYAAFTLTLEDNPGGADNMRRQLVWTGQGRDVPGDDRQRELLDWAATVFELVSRR